MKSMLPKANFNNVFLNCKLKVIKLGDNSPFDDSEKAREELKLHPVFLEFEIVDSSLIEQIGRTARIKLSNTDNLKVGDVFSIGPNEKMLSEGIVVWYASPGKRYGHDWLYVNASIKGSAIIDWK